MTADELAEGMHTTADISELLGRAGSYAALRFAVGRIIGAVLDVLVIRPVHLGGGKHMGGPLFAIESRAPLRCAYEFPSSSVFFLR